ncbi:MAG: 16S rRNA (cytosine(1402)-N(4))-methyltransferase [Candidatus Komeilibacteria bacterium RIFOXYC1_FULL_37_11]|uniref:Ribosomal RNA small subunit methyltransferase H n=1 Tax=Candidatus Komeilibacteria bacterium RIFOXYC1_FULL_37_11 TaxID=1798555 RepID=A0A1G2BX41_9BACT|nr:MAG: 16S rRNA (cytosine(1402)-N(4))-methyltransferase [Candidatus Komeilibacteria bacterium RIFOXYC1_FULL_37_11]OGY95854.1 MAG: 16S rRNA (cytosine(1402)-N(4))-methyltransferase [Candidatus Komeilibacteria bacterium RIFOXYD1_FULL_37_29]OGY97361.1 MAG: 16S rRNA (cytosine(1402)-N(4))-methyltransferase [Candidatus Komeilibacteria bacterium RIFOXYD2_FULL_37_8]
MTEYQHTSVLVEELIDLLAPQSNGNYIDLTLGGGGHSQAILEKTGPDGKVLAFELDGRAISASQDKLKKYQNRLIIINSSYVNLQAEFNRQKINISGIVADLGLSSDQLDKAERGFSFKDHGSLDMRFDPNGQTLTASDIVTDYTEEQILKIFQEYGEVKQAKRLARGLVSWRKNLDKQKQKPIKTSMLVGAILQILNIKEDNLKRFRIHPATQVFQALRIAVNDELNNLKKVLPQAYQTLPSGGRLAVISFHSLEDRIVKQYFKKMTQGCICPPETPVCRCNNQPKIRLVNKKAIRPSAVEISKNPRSRSAILRVIEKI